MASRSELKNLHRESTVYLPGATTRPLDIVEIEKTEKEVVFRVKHKIRDCG